MFFMLKRIFTFLLILALMPAGIDAQNVIAGKSDDMIAGDANSDGVVDISDVLLTVDFVLGKETASFVKEAADMNKDAVIDISDVLLIVDKILGKGEQNDDDGTPQIDDDGANPNLPVLAPPSPGRHPAGS